MCVTTKPAADTPLRHWGWEVVWLPLFPSTLPSTLVNPAGVPVTHRVLMGEQMALLKFKKNQFPVKT